MTIATLPLTRDELENLCDACTCALVLWGERLIKSATDPDYTEYSEELCEDRRCHNKALRDRVREVIDSLS